MIEFDEKFEAPALARGIGLLKIMKTEEEFTLEKLAELTNTPKSSLLRLLDTLQKLDLVTRNEISKKYYSQRVILEKESLTESGAPLNLPKIMESICTKSSRSVEWYIKTEVGMTLVERRIPQDQEVQVRAKIGFIRRWGSELEAVSCLGYAFGKTKSGIPNNLYKGDENLEKVYLSPNEIKQQIENAQTKKYVIDSHYNSNGIKRSAIPIFKAQKLIGILAVAEHKSLNYSINGKDLITVLQNEFEIN